MATKRIYTDAGEFNSATPPPPAGSYYNRKEQYLSTLETYRRDRGRHGCSSGSCCFLTCLCSTFAVLNILFCIATLVFGLVIQPKAPRFDVENVHISGLDTSFLPIRTNITYEIMACNPNKKIGIYHDKINVDVEMNGESIGDGSILAFYQGHKNSTYLTGDISSQGLTLNSDTLALLTNDPTNVSLSANVDVKARIKVGSIKSTKITIKFYCDLNVDLTRSNGSQLTHKICKVKKWKIMCKSNTHTL